MLDRGQIEKTLKDTYAARVRGDARETARFFTDDAEFRMVGSPDASPVAMRTVGKDDLCSHLDRLIQAFEFKDHTVLAMLIDGPRAAVHSRVTVRANPNGASATTELFDLIEFKDGRISSFTQFCDTALASKMLSM